MIKLNKSLLAWGVICGLAGCQANDDSIDLFIAQTELAAKRQIDELVPAGQFVATPYTQRKERGPFMLPQAALIHSQPMTKVNCWQPKLRKKAGKLERFPLEKLRLKGVMGNKSSVSGLIQTPDGAVHKVKSGQYLGLNHGKVVKVTARHLIIQETLPDGLGCWQQRSVKLALK
ncbi:fimbrial protein [Vibrio albus]|uniref:Fimbrial protein n=1 Tax=Vibrio albus TaxID=2200953 RepID=A0A2U3B8T4_9VIBR|nr:pilus assembly protein PilP [Vibrio albus]PWI33181.1 fimbrial protein [Vibrio albus]